MNLSVLIIGGPSYKDYPERLYRAVYQALTTTSNNIEVDFTGTTGITADFVLAAFGDLTERFPKDVLEARIHPLFVDDVSMKVYRMILEHGDQYQNNPQYRQIVGVIKRRRELATPP